MDNELKIGSWRVFPRLNQLQSGTLVCKIKSRSMDVLVYMAARPGEVLSVEELVGGVWRGVVVGDNSVYQAIRELRSVFEAEGAGDYIETIPKRGYRLTAEVSRPAAPAAATSPAAANEARRTSRIRRAAVYALAPAIVVAGVIAGVVTSFAPDDELIVAVLPFADLSSGAGQEPLAEGVTQAIRHSLGRIGDLRVSAQVSSSYFRDEQQDLREVREQLGADVVLTGSVMNDGDRIRIMVDVSDTSTGLVLASQLFDEDFERIFEIQDSIAAAVADVLEISLGVGELGQLPDMTRDARAYEEYLLAQREELFTADSIRRAVDHLESAVEIDPEFSRAWFVLSYLYRNLRLFEGNAADVQEKIDLAFRRASTLTPDSPFVLNEQVGSALGRADWGEAGRLLQTLEASADRYGMRAEFDRTRSAHLLALGRVREAQAILRRLAAVDPLNDTDSFTRAQAHAFAGDFDTAIAELNRILERLDPLPMMFRGGATLTVLASGQREEIDRWLALVPNIARNVDPHFLLGRYLDAPDAGLAAIRATDFEAIPEINRFTYAAYASLFGDPELALAILRDIATETGWGPTLASIVWQPIYRDVRVLEGFKDLLADIGIAGFWRESGSWNDFCRPLGLDDFECE